MKNEKYRRYICWGVTAFIVMALLIALSFLLAKGDQVRAFGKLLLKILAPVTYGAVFAYLMTPIYNRVRDAVIKRVEKLIPKEDSRKHLAGAVATTASLAVLLAVVIGLISMLIPQLISSIAGIIEAMPSSIRNLELWLEQILADNPEMEAQVMAGYDAAYEYLQNWLTNKALPGLSGLLTGLSSGLMSAVNMILDVLIGLIVMIYLLNMKDKLITQAKMIIYGALPVKIANKVIEEARHVHSVFGGFIIGKLVDSLIIGLLCFVIMSIAKMPYVLLISVIIGATNVIPFFGPFIGAIPSAFLILLVSPVKCLVFIGLILILQQVDGNIIGPKILGESTGLSSFWVLFSILLFGGLFGFIGMIIGVPAFAVFYRLVTELVTYLLGKKQLSTDIADYDKLHHIDEEQKTFIKK